MHRHHFAIRQLEQFERRLTGDGLQTVAAQVGNPREIAPGQGAQPGLVSRQHFACTGADTRHRLNSLGTTAERQPGCKHHRREARGHGKTLVMCLCRHQQREAPATVAATLEQLTLLVAGDDQLAAITEQALGELHHGEAFRAAARAPKGNEQRRHVRQQMGARLGEQICRGDREHPSVQRHRQSWSQAFTDERRTARPGQYDLQPGPRQQGRHKALHLRPPPGHKRQRALPGSRLLLDFARRMQRAGASQPGIVKPQVGHFQIHSPGHRRSRTAAGPARRGASPVRGRSI